MWISHMRPRPTYTMPSTSSSPFFAALQARHFWVFCWLLMALILDHGKGRLKDLCRYLPAKAQILDADAYGPIRANGMPRMLVR